MEVYEILNEMDRIDGDLLFAVSSIMPTGRHEKRLTEYEFQNKRRWFLIQQILNTWNSLSVSVGCFPEFGED